MRLLIGNSGYIPAEQRERVDHRGWAQRTLWLADEGDVIVLPDLPDADYFEHICSVKGMSSDRITIVLAPEGRFGRRSIDPAALFEPAFLSDLANHLSGADLEEVFALYPSGVAELASALGIQDSLPGADFFLQGGARLADSKATFRALAAGVELATAPGRVCSEVQEAVHITHTLMSLGHGVIVKRAHGAGGAGNEIVIAQGDHAPAHIGARQVHRLRDSSVDAVTEYWEERWRWASEDGLHPVVVEQLLDVSDCLYVEFRVGDDRLEVCEAGSVYYEDGRIAREVVGIENLDRHVSQGLLDGAQSIVTAYRDLGYRGYMDVDAVLTPSGQLFFAEVNARTTSGTVLQRLLDDKRVCPGREGQAVLQESAGSEWGRRTTAEFVSVIREAGLLYDRSESSGVLLLMPISLNSQRPHARYALVADPAAKPEIAAALDRVFRDQG
jgi:hypothetical protein